MKAHAIFFFSLIITTSVNLFGQIPDNIKIENFSYPNPSVNNFFNWLNLTTMEWETEMKKFEFSDRGIDNGWVYYGSGASLKNGVFTIAKYPGNLMRITWSDFSGNNSTKLDGLIKSECQQKPKS